MKKTILFIFLFISISFIYCNISNAVYYEPIYEPFEAYVSNNSGANYYIQDSYNKLENKGSLKVNDKINILDEYEMNEGLYGKFMLNEDEVYIKISDVKSTDILYSNINKEEQKKIVVIASQGIKMRNGPSDNYYSEITIIPKGTELTGYFAKDNEMTVYWVYVEYQGNKGWINCSNNEVAFPYEFNSDVLLVNKTDIYQDAERTDNSSNASIPAYTVINTKDILSLNFRKFFTTAEYRQKFNIDENDISSNNYIKLNEKEGYINIEEYGLSCNETYTVKTDGMSLYKNPNDMSEIIIENIPKKTKLQYNFTSAMGRSDGTVWEYGFWAYTEYDGQKGWVQIINDDYLQQKDQTLEQINEITTSNKSSNNYFGKIAIIIVLTIVLICLVVILIKRLKNKK